VRKKYRKSDQYYIDQHDRMTIESLKKIDLSLAAAQKKLAKTKSEEDLSTVMQLRLKFLDNGVISSRIKRETLQRWISRDERKDDLIARYPVPPEPYCNRCRKLMAFEDYDFTDEDTMIRFFFSCGKGKRHNKLLYADGREYRPPAKYCPYCNGEIKSTTSKEAYKIICLDSCMTCTWTSEMVLDVSPQKKQRIKPVDEAERKKYCTDFVGRQTFLEDLKRIAEMSKYIDIKQKLEPIEKLKLPQVEERLKKVIEAKKYNKLQFSEVKVTGHLSVQFSVEDHTDRDSEKSIKALKKIMTDELFPTNWRLSPPTISCRLGLLTGQLKGFDLEEDLKRISEEIKAKKT